MKTYVHFNNISTEFFIKPENVEQIRKHFMFNFFFKSRKAYEIQLKNFVGPARPQTFCMLDNCLFFVILALQPIVVVFSQPGSGL
jgi:hypothetical protein